MPPHIHIHLPPRKEVKKVGPIVKELHGKDKIKQLERERPERLKEEKKKIDDAALENKYHTLLNRIDTRDARVKALELMLKAKKEKKPFSKKLLNAIKWIFVGFNFLRLEWPKNLLVSGKDSNKKQWADIWQKNRQRVFGLSVKDVEALLKTEREEREKDQTEFKKITS